MNYFLNGGGICYPANHRFGFSWPTAGRATFSKSAMTLSAFRDSSEIEFGVDDAYILTAGKDPTQRTLLHLKSRNGQCRDIELDFDGAVQQFSAALPVDGAAAAAWWAP